MEGREQLTRLLRDANLSVDEAALPGLLRFLQELERWNRSHNLTAVSDPAKGIETHLVDSLTLLPFLPSSARILDFGSGAGLPGLPLKIVRGDLSLCSIDAVAKKLAFQRHVVRLLGLEGVRVLHMRLEKMVAEEVWLGTFDRVVFRAVGDLFRFAPLVRPLIRAGGCLIAMKGPEGLEDWRRLQAAPLAGYENLKCEQFCLPESGAKRTLIFLKKAD